MKTLLVTGGAGFIGGNYVLRSLANDPGLRIVNLDVLTYAGNLDTLASLEGDDRHVFVRGDIGDADLVARLLDEYNPDGVVSFAAESQDVRSVALPVLRHRIFTNFNADSEGVTAADIVKRLIDEVPEPGPEDYK